MLGVCVCGGRFSCPDAMHFANNLRPWLQATFWKRNKIVSEARAELDNRRAVLAFKSSGVTQEGHQLRTESEPASDATHYVHIGHINLTTMHFVVLRLYTDLELLGLPADLSEDLGVLQAGPLPAASTDDSLGVCTDLEFYRDVLDLDLAWEVKLYTISGEERHWHRLDSSSSAVPLIPWPQDAIPSSRLWLGSASEAAKRAQSSRKRGPQVRGHDAGRRRVRGKQSTKLPQTAAEADAGWGDAAGDASASVGDSAAVDVEAGDELDHVAHGVGPYAETQPEDNAVVLEDGLDIAPGPLAEVAHAAGFHDNAPGGSDSDTDVSLDPLFDDFDGEHGPGERVEQRLLESDGDDVPQPAAAGAAPARVRHVAAGRRAGGLPLERYDFELPGAGRLRSYPHTNALHAICTNEGHGECRMERTCNPHKSKSHTSGVFAGQGRPIGLLANWLYSHAEFASQQQHLRDFRHTRASRSEARANFMSEPGAGAFCERAERPQREGEPVEPSWIR